MAPVQNSGSKVASEDDDTVPALGNCESSDDFRTISGPPFGPILIIFVPSRHDHGIPTCRESM